MNEIILECKNLCKTFEKNGNKIKAVDNVSLSLKKGECFGLVGESGSGKSTLSNLICLLEKADSGKIIFDGKEIFDSSEKNGKIDKKNKLSAKELKDFRRRFQIIFQDPYASLNPKKKIIQILEEPLKIHKIGKTKEERLFLINEMRTLTGLPPDILQKFPSELSGGQRQRVSIASSMILKPDFVILDESVSALDVLVQAQVLNLLKSMQKSLNLTYFFISHNLNVVSYMADRIAVMYKGKIVEENTTEKIIENPEHFYTKELLDAAEIK